MGWILVMFDLPVMTDDERRVATRFRKELLDDGYMMIQFSVYARPCVTFDTMETHAKRIQIYTPAAGNVRIIFFTDQQWGRSIVVVGPNYHQGSREVDPQIPQQVEFWE
jgi:CRISPR-associated protein Cas2